MTTKREHRLGKVEWFDLTVDDAESVKSFYEQVVGWTTNPFDMGGYDDYCLVSKDQSTVAGICHARGPNANLPAQWILYIYVDRLDESLRLCLELGGKQLSEIRHMSGQGKYCIISDPAGAVCALFEPIADQ